MVERWSMLPAPWAFHPESDRLEVGEDGSLLDLLSSALRFRRSIGEAWSAEVGEAWVVVTPPGSERREQGWKLHLSATILSAPSVLNRVLPILTANRCHFKFARSLRELERLNAPNTPEGRSGKFLTIYPADDATAISLAKACHDATVGLAGPRILSDQPWCPGSLVHARYGAFRARTVFTPFGTEQAVLRRPDGALVEDVRVGRFAPPAWVENPFPAPPAAIDKRSNGGGVQIGHYKVEGALKRSNRGGTYRARSVDGGGEVVLKEARPHVGTDRLGRDVRDRLRNEHAVLRSLAELAIPPAPKPFELFEHGGHLFLAREYLPGISLRTHLRRRYGSGILTLPAQELGAIAMELTRLVERCHAAGWIVRDINPNNIVVMPSDAGSGPRLGLIDLELAYSPETPVAAPFRGATTGYASPQQAQDLLPSPADDFFSIGTTLFFAATGTDPFFLSDDLGGRSEQDKAADLLDLHGVPSEAAANIVRCLSPDPFGRPSCGEVAGQLNRSVARPRPRAVAPRPEPAKAELEGAIDGVVSYLAAAWRDDADGRLWPATSYGSATDRLGISSGGAGIGLFLVQCLKARPSPIARDLLERIVAATEAELDAGTPRSAGLYYGLAGIAWFLAEAGEALDQPRLVQRGTRLVAGLPALPDIAHVSFGNAGIGLAAARLFLATGDGTLLERVDALARSVGEMAERGPNGLVWPVSAKYAPDLTVKSHPGYAYGVAGIAYFLMMAAQLTGRERYAALGNDALSGLIQSRKERDGRRWWPTSSLATSGSADWLKGASGIGTTFIRAYLLTGEPAYRATALECAEMVRPVPRHGPLTQHNGLAGIGEFFLDLADQLGEERARGDAWEIARTIYAQRIDRRADGFGICFPDEDGLGRPDFMTGASGIAAYLLRLSSGGPRLMMLDEVFERASPATWPAAAMGRGGVMGDDLVAVSPS